jgi:tryptophanyl-tRNA synthetase
MSGMRSTGRLHLGNYWGALKNWVELQNKYDCYFMVADWHMLTTGYEDTADLKDNVREMTLDWLAAGLDPKKCVIFKQSDVPQHAELTLLLSMVTPLSWLENNPTWKEQLKQLSETKHAKVIQSIEWITDPQEVASISSGSQGRVLKNAEEAVKEVRQKVLESLRTSGLLGYPILQASDILLYEGELVPVGKDQVPHVEISREIARRFNSIYSKGSKRILIEPEPLLTETPKVPGLDGRKMSKSYGNSINLLETPASLQSKIMSAYTDKLKIKANDPGHPEPCEENPPGCTIYALHKLYSDYWQKRKIECEKGQIGCVACKKDVLKSMEKPFAEFREARERLANRQGTVEEILAEGARKAKAEAEKTMEKVRHAMHLK